MIDRLRGKTSDRLQIRVHFEDLDDIDLQHNLLLQ